MGVGIVREVNINVVIACSRRCRRVNAGNIVIVDEYRGMCGGGGCEGEGALEILPHKWVVYVDGIGGEICADEGRRVHIRSDLTCIERRVIVIADVGGSRVVGWGFDRLSFTGEVLSEGEASVVV